MTAITEGKLEILRQSKYYMDLNKNNWIEETLKSGENRKAVPLPDDFFDSLIIKMESTKPQKIKTAWIISAAACFLALVSVNLVGLKKNSRAYSDNQNSHENIRNEFDVPTYDYRY